MMGYWSAGFLLFFLLLVCPISGAVQSDLHQRHNQSQRHHSYRHGRQSPYKMLFVFGDSYADTGNLMKALASSWKEPYGVTFPGKPTGRFSDGRVLTDFLAALIGTRSPLPYKWRKLDPKHLRHGMNFAYGGTGVFTTATPAPNLTAQIDLFHGMIQDGTFTQSDVQSSIALISVAGNDYTAYVAQGGTVENARPFVESLIKQLATDLKSIQTIGVRKVVVTAIEPIGCLPSATISLSYKKCNDSANMVSGLHNLLLEQAVQQINYNATAGRNVAIFDLYDAFMSNIQNPHGQQASQKFENTLKPCCEGVSPEFACGSVAANLTKLYTVCDKPESVFFWDAVHPSQGGWTAISSHLHSTLSKLY